MPKNWIAGAISKPGAFTAQAEAHDMSVAEMAAHVLKEGSKASAKTKKRAVLARTLRRMGHKTMAGGE